MIVVLLPTQIVPAVVVVVIVGRGLTVIVLVEVLEQPDALVP